MHVKLLALAIVTLISTCNDALSAECWLGEHFTRLQNYTVQSGKNDNSREQCLAVCKADADSAKQICNRLGTTYVNKVEFGCFYKSGSNPTELLLKAPSNFYGCTEVCECLEGGWYEEFRHHCVEPTGIAVANMPNGDKGGGYYAKDEYLFKSTGKAACRTLPSGEPDVRRAGTEFAGRWTPWMNTDQPGGNGDWEALNAYIKSGKACIRPIEVQCRTEAGVSWLDAGQVYSCNRNTGGTCVNNAQTKGEICLDYEVRFLCP